MRRVRIPLAPAEGWATVGLVALMAVIAAWSIDDAGWVLGRSDWTDFLMWAALGGVVAGFVAAKVGWNRWLANTIGAVFAALIVPILVGEVLLKGASPGAQYTATAAATVRAWFDLVVNGQVATRETGHHLLVLGLLCWATGQFAASAVFRHHRPLSAVVVIGAILIGNMAATVRDQLGYLVLFTLASLFLLIRLHASEEQATWLRRRIGDPSAIGSIYLRGGTVFILAAILGSLALTATARSAPLAGAWEDVKPWLLDVSAAIQRFLPAGVDSRGIGAIQFGPNATIQNVWTPNSTLAMTVRRPAGDKRVYYWRAAAYDHFNLFGWDWTEPTRTSEPAGREVLAGTPDAAPTEGRSPVAFSVTPAEYRGPYVVSPMTPVSVNRDTSLIGLGKDAFYQAIEISGHDPYDVSARVPLYGDSAPGGVTENGLRVAGTAYPAEVTKRYLQVPDGAIGPEARKVLDAVLGTVTNDNPYDVAKQMASYMQSPANFKYDPNVLDVQCGDRSAAECFAWSKRGYCQHYATLMTILLRAHGIPARFVQGFLPGSLDPRTGIEQVYFTSAHAWVEAYFPGYGWVTFDPTGGGIAQAEPIPAGRPVDSPSPRASASRASGGTDDPNGPVRRSIVPGGGTTSKSGDTSGGAFIVVSILLLGSVGILAFLAWRRGPRGPTTPDGVYAGVARLAGRFGFGPRPTQTAYEYAAALGDVLPGVRPELQTVATAKVEVAYGRRALGEDRIRILREAHRRLRVSLLKLAFRRRPRQPGSGRPTN